RALRTDNIVDLLIGQLPTGELHLLNARVQIEIGKRYSI
ncbi:MAG: hypothetical protein FD143_3650, partial [Ignavibacteria bacterium]